MTKQLIPHAINSSVINQRSEDGYISATAMCKAAGKRWNNYLRNVNTEAYLEALAIDTRIRATDLIQIKRGGIPSEQGSWVHPKVALHLAQWLSPEFAVQVTNWVMEWMTGKVPLPMSKTEQITHAVNQIMAAQAFNDNELLREAEAIKDKIQSMSTELRRLQVRSVSLFRITAQ